MTRFSIAIVAISAFAICACERHPIPGEEPVTHTHGSNGAHVEHATEEGEHKKEEEKPKVEATPAKTEEGKPAEGGEKSKFFPDEKK